MKRIFLFAALNLQFIIAFTQEVRLNTNGFNLELKPVDTVTYAEYSINGLTRKSFDKEDFSIVKLKTSFGIIHNSKSSKVNEIPVYKSRFYVYVDGTLQAPTTQLFFYLVTLTALQNYTTIWAV